MERVNTMNMIKIVGQLDLVMFLEERRKTVLWNCFVAVSLISPETRLPVACRLLAH